MKVVAAEVAEELKDKSWDERFDWITSIKDEGNKFVKTCEYE